MRKMQKTAKNVENCGKCGKCGKMRKNADRIISSYCSRSNFPSFSFGRFRRPVPQVKTAPTPSIYLMYPISNPKYFDRSSNQFANQNENIFADSYKKNEKNNWKILVDAGYQGSAYMDQTLMSNNFSI